MSTITAILEADADGTLHLPLPAELRKSRLKVTATLEAAPEATTAKARTPREALKELHKRGAFKAITDPVAWQRAERQDRSLPGRD